MSFVFLDDCDQANENPHPLLLHSPSCDSTTFMLVKVHESKDQFQLFFLLFATHSLDLRRGDVEPLGN